MLDVLEELDETRFFFFFLDFLPDYFEIRLFATAAAAGAAGGGAAAGAADAAALDEPDD